MIGALKATPAICFQQHDCVATLIGKASSESEGARWGGVVPRIVLVVGVGVCVLCSYPQMWNAGAWGCSSL